MITYCNNKKYNSVWSLARLFGDLISCVFSFFLVYKIREFFLFREFLGSLPSGLFYFIELSFLPLFLILIFNFYGLYERIFYSRKTREIYLIFKSLTWLSFSLVLYFYFFKIPFSRIIFFLWIPMLFILLVFIRIFIKNLQIKYYLKNKITTNIAIIGSKENIDPFLKFLKHYHFLSINIVFIHSYTLKDLKNSHQTEVDQIFLKIENAVLDEVFFIDEYLTYDGMFGIVQKVSNQKLVFRIVTSIFYLYGGDLDVNSLGEIPMLDLSKNRPSTFYSFLKKILDLLLSLIFLCILILPMLLIGLLIKISSSGPVFIKQERVGYKGKKFFMYKFRTMYENVSLYAKAPNSKNDTRVTFLGSMLRMSSLDEIPQFLNVLKGDMSLVGPRPEMFFIVEKYKPWQLKRLESKPGITGLWQILGRKDIVLSEHLEYDFFYIYNRSIIYDFVILIKTVPVVFFAKGAF